MMSDLPTSRSAAAASSSAAGVAVASNTAGAADAPPGSSVTVQVPVASSNAPQSATTPLRLPSPCGVRSDAVPTSSLNAQQQRAQSAAMAFSHVERAFGTLMSAAARRCRSARSFGRGNVLLIVILGMCCLNVATWGRMRTYQDRIRLGPGGRGPIERRDGTAFGDATADDPTLSQAGDPPEEESGDADGAHSAGGANEPPVFARDRAPADPFVAQYDRDGDGVITVNEYFDRVFYVNVNAETGRRDTMRASLRSAGIVAERYPALTPGELKAQYRSYMSRPIGPYERRRGGNKLLKSEGAFAYLKTCEKVIGTARARNYRRILLLDDDVRFHAQFASEFDRKVRAIRGDWKLLYLGASQYNWGVRSLTWTDESRDFYHPLVTDGSFAVGIDASVFELIAFEISKEVHTFDSGALRAVLVAHHLASFVFFPNLVIADVSQSLIRGPRNVTAIANQFRWTLEDYVDASSTPEPLPKVCVVLHATKATHAPALLSTLRSLVAQTYANFEIVVVTDTSAASTLAMSVGDSRVKVVHNEAGHGPYAARNEALRQCDGDVWALHTVGDIASPDRIELQLQPIVDNRADVTFAYSLRLPPGHSGAAAAQAANGTAVFDATIRAVFPHAGAGKGDARDRLCCGASGSRVDLGTVVGRRSVLRDVGLFDEEAQFGGDEEWAERYVAQSLRQFFAEGAFEIGAYLEKRVAVRPHFEVIRDVVAVGETPPRPPTPQYRTIYRRRIRQNFGNDKSVNYNPF